MCYSIACVSFTSQGLMAVTVLIVLDKVHTQLCECFEVVYEVMLGHTSLTELTFFIW